MTRTFISAGALVVLIAVSPAWATPPGSGVSAEQWKKDHPAGAEPAPPPINPDVVMLPNGQWQVSCTGFINACTKLARASCPDGFKIVGDVYSDGGYRLTRTVECR